MNFILKYFKKGEIERLLKEGNKLVEEKDFKQALSSFEKVLSYDENNLCAKFGKAK